MTFRGRRCGPSVVSVEIFPSGIPNCAPLINRLPKSLSPHHSRSVCIIIKPSSTPTMLSSRLMRSVCLSPPPSTASAAISRAYTDPLFRLSRAPHPPSADPPSSGRPSHHSSEEVTQRSSMMARRSRARSSVSIWVPPIPLWPSWRARRPGSSRTRKVRTNR